MAVFRKPGDRVGPCTINKRLGGGGNGIAYRATDAKGEFVVLKLLTEANLAQANFEIELSKSVLAACTSTFHGIEEHFVPVLALLRDSDDFFLVMPYMIGGSLADALAKRGKLDYALVRTTIRPPMLACHVMHKVGVTHRDIKPANLLLRDHPGRSAVADFGISAPANTPLRAPGYSTGYSCPEQMFNQPASPAQDVFSFGATIYELATGIRPFAAGTEDEEDQLVSDYTVAHTPLATLAPNIPQSVSRAVDAALSKNPLARPSLRELYESFN